MSSLGERTISASLDLHEKQFRERLQLLEGLEESLRDSGSDPTGECARRGPRSAARRTRSRRPDWHCLYSLTPRWLTSFATEVAVDQVLRAVLSMTKVVRLSNKALHRRAKKRRAGDRPSCKPHGAWHCTMGMCRSSAGSLGSLFECLLKRVHHITFLTSTRTIRMTSPSSALILWR